MGHRQRGRRGHRPHHRGHPGRASGRADRPGRRPPRRGAEHRGRRVRPGARRRPGPRRRGPRRRRAGHRQVDAAARRRRPRRPRRARAARSSTSPARSRPPRCGCGPSGSRRWPRTLFLAAETDLATVLGQIDAVQPDLVVVDSVQTIASGEVEGAAGNVSQVREVAASLIQVAKAPRHRHAAGRPRHQGRLDRRARGCSSTSSTWSCSSRATGTRGCGWCGRSRTATARPTRSAASTCPTWASSACPTPAGCSSRGARSTVPGTCVTVTLEGRRPLMTEVQALVAKSEIPTPRRATSGLDSARVSMIIAVLAKRAAGADRQLRRLPLHGRRRAAHRARLRPGDRARRRQRRARTSRCPTTPIAFGELGLAGEIRPVTGMPRRLAEAAGSASARPTSRQGCSAAARRPRACSVVRVRRHPYRGARRPAAGARLDSRLTDRRQPAATKGD